MAAAGLKTDMRPGPLDCLLSGKAPKRTGNIHES
jgi:hypothetical protein